MKHWPRGQHGKEQKVFLSLPNFMALVLAHLLFLTGRGELLCCWGWGWGALRKPLQQNETVAAVALLAQLFPLGAINPQGLPHAALAWRGTGSEPL